MIYAEQRPSRIIYTFGGIDYKSYWNGVFNPVVFRVKRMDMLVNYTAENTTIHPGKTNVILSTGVGGDIWQCLAPGDKVYINSGMYVGTFTVLDVSNHPPFIVLDYPYQGPSSNGYLNALTTAANYIIETKVYEWDNWVETYVGQLDVAPDTEGYAVIDPAPLLRALVGFENVSNYQTLNIKDSSLGGGYIMYSRFRYINKCTNATVYGSWLNWGLYYYVNGAKQIRDRFGQSYGEYIMTNANVSADKKGKFMTMFKRPRLFYGYPFDLTFIRSHYLDGDIIARGNSDGVATVTTNLATHKQSINRVLMDSAIVNAASDEITAWLEIAGPYIDCYVDDDYVDDGYTICIGEMDIPIGDIPDSGL